jgi:hypothetical protein
MNCSSFHEVPTHAVLALKAASRNCHRARLAFVGCLWRPFLLMGGIVAMLAGMECDSCLQGPRRGEPNF